MSFCAEARHGKISSAASGSMGFAESLARIAQGAQAAKGRYIGTMCGRFTQNYTRRVNVMPDWAREYLEVGK
jgi:hypothetical protein